MLNLGPVITRRLFKTLFLQGLITAILLFATTFGIYVSLDRNPKWIGPLGLNGIPHFRDKLELGEGDYRIKRSSNSGPYFFTGDLFQAYFGVELPPSLWAPKFINEYGYLDTAPRKGSEVDFVIVGDSFVGSGTTLFISHLEQRIAWTGLNLGRAGYAPHQYLDLLKKYAFDKTKVKFVVFCFFEGNDLKELDFVLGRSSAKRDGLWSNYVQAVKQSGQVLFHGFKHRVFYPLLAWLKGGYGPDNLHPYLAEISLGGHESIVRFPSDYIGKYGATSELVQSASWKKLQAILGEYGELSRKHHVLPFVLFIPASPHVYAPYVKRSGKHWQQYQGQALARSSIVRDALAEASHGLGLEFVDLLPVFRQAADQGVMAFYPFDSHWNDNGTRLAALAVKARLIALRRL